MEQIKFKILEFFRGLTFDEPEHKYFVQGKLVKKSVSALIKNFYIPFNSYEKSKGTAYKTGRTQEEVLEDWKSNADRAIEIGKQAHLFGEIYAFNRNLRPQSMYDVAIMKFWNDLPPHIKPVVCELQMYHKKKMYAGTSDILLYNEKTQKFIIGDYKTNKDLYKNFKGQKMLGRFSHLLDNPFNHYQIQLSYYQILFEQSGLEVSNRKIIWVKPDGNYEIFDTEDFTQYLR